MSGARRSCRLPYDTPDCAANVGRNDNDSFYSPGSRVSHLERATRVSSPDLKKRKINFGEHKQAALHQCSNTITRDFLYSHSSVLASLESLTKAKDEAAEWTHSLWLRYFNETGMAFSALSTRKNASMPTKRARKGVRCLRGRKSSISPLVSCTDPISFNAPTSNHCFIFEYP